jgi:hypothetical protein
MRVPHPEEIATVAEAAVYAVHYIQMTLAVFVFSIGITFIISRAKGEKDFYFPGLTY